MTEFKNDKYFVRKTIVYYDESSCIEKGLLDTFEPVTTQSANYENWRAILDLKTCVYCRKMHGKVFGEDEILYEEPPIHENCRCEIKRLKAIYDGYATRNGQDGADYWLIQYGTLPKYYMTKEDAKQQGWRAIEGNLAEVAPGMMIGGDEYKNRNGHLPKWSSSTSRRTYLV